MRSVPFGKYCLSNPFVFSLEPRCHGLCGSQKYTSMSVARVNRLWSDISEPRSQVSDLYSSSGSFVGLLYQGLDHRIRFLVFDLGQHHVAASDARPTWL